MTEKYPRLQVTVLIQDRVSGRGCLRSMTVTPQQLEAYKAQVFVAVVKTLTVRLLADQMFLDFLDVADPLWKNILLEIPEGQRGKSNTLDPLALRYCEQEIGMSNELFHKQCLERFGGNPAEHLKSPYFLTELEIGKWKSTQGMILAVCTGDPADLDRLKIHQTVTEVVDPDTALDLEELLLLGKLALPAIGQVYGKYTLDWMVSQGWSSNRQRAKALREKSKADAAALRAKMREEALAKLPKVSAPAVAAPGAR